MARILVVDDEEGLREFLAEALAGDGHSVEAKEDGQAALEELGRRGYDLLVTDLKMPRLDGLELLRRAKAELPELEVLVLTAHGSVDSAVEAMKLGAFDYLQKPLSSPAELRLLARRALERRELSRYRERAHRAREAAEPRLSYGDPAMAPAVEAIRKVAPTEATVLLLGESGTGKEVAARALHQASRRAEGPFVAINCAAISETLLESELFGHERGAFTGAAKARPGRIELAQGGTFFLDEIGELRPELQAKLLRVLQERRFERVGGSRAFDADVRFVAATNRDLEAMLAAGTFREDLYHRLAVFPILLPPLRERRRDIRPLAEALLERLGSTLGKPGLHLDAEAAARLEAADWPGNIRELGNALERAAILADGTRLESRHFVLRSAAAPAAPAPSPAQAAESAATLADLEREAIEQALAELDGNRRKAAERLGIGLRTLYDKLKRYGLE
jgi:two-component system response regulator AtoC